MRLRSPILQVAACRRRPLLPGGPNKKENRCKQQYDAWCGPASSCWRLATRPRHRMSSRFPEPSRRARTGCPLPGATVSVIGTTINATTDTSGRYALNVPRSVARGGRIQIKVDAPGLPSKVTDVEVSSTALTVDVALSLAFAEQVTVGSRRVGAEAQKAVPVDVITQDEIAATGYAETAQVIQALAPSFNFPRPTITDGTDTVRPATLRGLGPDQVLVLVNGKRRHQSALVHLNGSIGRGSTGVDLNAIPVSAIERIEVLRDGAAAQYGSDAIAGVINIVLKGGVSRPTVTSKFGLSKGSFAGNSCTPSGLTCSDGERHRLLRRRAVRRRRIVGARRRQGQRHRRRRVSAPQPHEPRIVRSARSDRRRGCRQQRRGRAESPLGRSRYARRHDVRQRQRAAERRSRRASSTASAATAAATANSAGFYRRALDARNWPQIYPLGFLPVIEPTVVDASGTAGVRGVCSKWTYDASGEYGHNSFALHDRRHAERLARTVDAAEQDAVRRRHARAQPVRRQRRRQPAVHGRRASPGRSTSHSAPSIAARTTRSAPASPTPTAMAASRTSSAAGRPSAPRCFLDSVRRTRWTSRATASPATSTSRATSSSGCGIGLAGRAEHYSDFGGTLDGKLTARVQPDPRVRRPRLDQHRLPRPVARPVVLLVDRDELREPRVRDWCRSSR